MMENRDETQRLREAFAATSPEDVATPDCPPAEQIWEAVKDDLDPSELRKILLHVASCPVCTESWQLAREVEGDTAGEAVRRSPGVRGSRRFGWLAAASAAAAVFAVFLISPSLTERFSTVSSARSGDSEVLTLVTDNVPLSRSECRPRWVAVEGATYDVQLLTENLELLVEEKGLTVPEFSVPESVLQGLPPEARLLMVVEARRVREAPKSSTIRLPC